ncbi:YkgJ family cysteine cluster protein [Thermogladius sp. 4427co]|uniref:YkgJ family cysteine cluster protein n=1 Tax=Thermogladius sp. 4427co TaxID=3450718 RepID=UPI003F7B186C
MVRRLRFNCLRCDHCCFFEGAIDSPVVMPFEADVLKLIAQRLGVSGLEFKPEPSGFYRWVMRGYCPFYDRGSRACRIHRDKPFACRMYPLIVNLDTLELSVSLKCDWVREYFEEVSKAGDVVDRVFPDEYRALNELFKILVHAREGVAYAIYNGTVDTGRPEESCTIIYHKKLVSTPGTGIVLAIGCGSEKLKKLLEEQGANIITVSEMRLNISLRGSASRLNE